MFFRSIRFKMLLWYMLVLTVTLLIFSFIVYGGFRGILYNDLDDLLCSRAEGVINSINTYWVASELAEMQGSPINDMFIRMAHDWVEPKRKDPELMGIFVQVLDSKGKRIVASENGPDIEPISTDSMEDVLDEEESFDTVKGRTPEGKRSSFRIYTKPVTRNDRIEYIVQVAGSTDLLSLATGNLAWILFLILPLTVFLAGVPALILVRLTLKPVDRMITTINQTTAENLKLKIHMPDTKDEIKRLADTFNEMIDRLDRSFSSQQSFIQDISCELKNPLGDLKKEFSEAAAKSLSADEYKSILNRGLDEVNKFEQVIEELETLARFDNNRIALEIRKVDLRNVLDDAIHEIKERTDNKAIGVSSMIREPMIIDGDGKQLRVLFDNLLDNAVKYTNRKGAIAISARKQGRSAIITVSDTGLGIEENELPYIFDRFYQVNKSRVLNGSFGLGLSIAKSVIEVHRGTIDVESRTGRGSIFTVTLPISYPA